MLRVLASLVLVVATLASPSRLLAGGPPWLCIPIDGVTPENAKACAELVTEKLGDKLWRADQGFEILPHSNQWYLTLYMGKEVALNEAEAALQGSDWSIPRDKLRLFGHAILEIDLRGAPRHEMLADLEAISHVSVTDSDEKNRRLFVTLDMPYPKEPQPRDRRSVGWKTFVRGDLSTDQSARSEPAATPRTLPSYVTIRDVVARRDAQLCDIHWNPNFACRILGFTTVASATNSPGFPVGHWTVEFANGVKETCQIDADGNANVEEPQRRSAGTVIAQEGKFVLTFRDDRTERWSPVGKRYIVEHWFPANQFPTSTPVMGIAERASSTP